MQAEQALLGMGDKSSAIFLPGKQTRTEEANIKPVHKKALNKLSWRTPSPLSRNSSFQNKYNQKGLIQGNIQQKPTWAITGPCPCYTIAGKMLWARYRVNGEGEVPC